jgi:2-C-methyl-D-erythritol 2,4-cyclodiphosphate synthase
VHVEGTPGLAGHSDADVVCHALADAVLGAIGLGDLGTHFPETDPSLTGISGSEILGRVRDLARAQGYWVSSCDVTVVAARPPIDPLRDEMRRNVAVALGLPVDRVSVKATRPEGMGLIDDGAACMALVVLAPE